MRATLGLMLASLALVLLTTPLAAAPPSRIWLCDGKFGLCRYVERDSKQVERAASGDIAKVRNDGQWKGIDPAGTIADNPHDDGRNLRLIASDEARRAPHPMLTRDPSGVLHCGNGLKLFDRDGLWGIKDTNGSEVIAPRYRALDCFKDGVAWAAVDEQRHWCAIGPDGGPRENQPCTVDYYPMEWTHTKPEPFDANPYESSVLWVRAYLEFGAGRRQQPPGFIGVGGGITF